MIVIAILAVVCIIAIVAYAGVQRNASSSVVQSSVRDATSTLEVYKARKNLYPSNIADTQYAPPQNAALILYTNSTQTPVYQNLTAAQNAQLFLNACNGFMPIVSGGTTYNTVCSYAGINLHLSGQSGSNVLLHGPTIQESAFVLTCGSVCISVRDQIKASFTAQGGTFPISVPSKGSTLPAPELVSSGPATRFCLEGRSPSYNDVIFHSTSENTKLAQGACPTDAELHYP